MNSPHNGSNTAEKKLGRPPKEKPEPEKEPIVGVAKPHWFGFDSERDAKLIHFLKLDERGSDTLVIHPGSDSVKIGLASQQHPFVFPNVVAHRTKGGRLLFDEKEREYY